MITNLIGDQCSNIVEQWRLKNTLIVLSSRGGEGQIALSYKYLSKSNLIFGADLAQDVFQRLDQRVQTRICRKR